MKKIILVDDEPLALERMERLLGKYPEYEVIGKYGSAIEAMNAVKRVVPDIIITDICMARMDGLSLIDKMREQWNEQVGFIIVSGYSQFEYAKRALQLGVSDYLLKPIIEKELVEALRKVCIKQDLDKIERVVEISKEKMSAEIKLAERIASAAISFDQTELERCLVETEQYVEVQGQSKEIQNRIFWIVFTILDSRVENQEHEFLETWKYCMETNSGLPGFCIRDYFEANIRECMLISMEKQGYHSGHPIAYIKLYIANHYKEDISLGWFGEKLYVNSAYLGQKFKKETGVSVNHYLHSLRIEEAKRLADTTEKNWSEIASEIGYKNYLSFFEHFQKIENVSPSDYRGENVEIKKI